MSTNALIGRVITPFELFGQRDCDICGERLHAADAVVETEDRNRNHKSVICHAECGAAEGLDELCGDLPVSMHEGPTMSVTVDCLDLLRAEPA